MSCLVDSGTGRLVDGPPSSQSCVPASVELVDKDEDADENVDADQTRTERPVSEQPTVYHSARGNRH